MKPFKCDICDKEFISTITFKRHAIVHSGMIQNVVSLVVNSSDLSEVKFIAGNKSVTGPHHQTTGLTYHVIQIAWK